MMLMIMMVLMVMIVMMIIMMLMMMIVLMIMMVLMATLSKKASNGISVLFPDHNHPPTTFLNLCADSTCQTLIEQLWKRG